MWTKLLGLIAKPVAGIATSIAAHKKAKLATKLEQAKLSQELTLTKLQGKIDITKAQVQGKIKLLQSESEAVSDYDNLVLKNRSASLADEFIIAMFFLSYIAHFIPALQPYMAGGWQAMGYASVPWWYEFGMIVIIVSTLGGMRILKLWSEGLVGKVSALGKKAKI